MLTKLMDNQSQQVQRVGVVWIASEDGLVDASSLLQAAGLMVSDGDLHGVLHSGALCPQVSHSTLVRLSAPKRPCRRATGLGRKGRKSKRSSLAVYESANEIPMRKRGEALYFDCVNGAINHDVAYFGGAGVFNGPLVSFFFRWEFSAKKLRRLLMNLGWEGALR